MRIPTEYILALVSIGALSTIALNALSISYPSAVGDVLLKPKHIVVATFTPLPEEDRFSIITLSDFLSLFTNSTTTEEESEESIEPETAEAAVFNSVSKDFSPGATEEVIQEEAPAVEEVTEPDSTPTLPQTIQFETFHYYNSSLVEKDPISFAASVKNISDTFTATSTFIFTFDKNNDGTIDVVLQERTLLPLIPDETRSESWRNALLPAPGTHTATMCIVAEEGSGGVDNCKSFEFTVVPQKSDLSLRPLSIIPENPTAGDVISVSSVIKNQGKGQAASSITRLRIDAQNNGTWDVISNFETGVILSGKELSKEWTSAWRSVRGLAKIEVCTDKDDVLDELDERNNCRVDIFTVTPGEYTGTESVTFEIEGGALSPLTHSVIPGGSIIFSNRDSKSYSISGDIGSTFLSPNTEGSTQAPLYEGTYTFSTITEGASFEGTVIVE